MALETGVRLTPQIGEVFTGIAGRTAAMFRLGRTIEFISDESIFFMSLALFFMNFAFLLFAVDNCGVRLTSWDICAPDQAGTPDETQAARRVTAPDNVGAPNHAVARDE